MVDLQFLHNCLPPMNCYTKFCFSFVFVFVILFLKICQCKKPKNKKNKKKIKINKHKKPQSSVFLDDGATGVAWSYDGKEIIATYSQKNLALFDLYDPQYCADFKCCKLASFSRFFLFFFIFFLIVLYS